MPETKGLAAKAFGIPPITVLLSDIKQVVPDKDLLLFGITNPEEPLSETLPVPVLRHPC
jgi:hypothetical protein